MCIPWQLIGVDGPSPSAVASDEIATVLDAIQRKLRQNEKLLASQEDIYVVGPLHNHNENKLWMLVQLGCFSNWVRAHRRSWEAANPPVTVLARRSRHPIE